MEPDAVKTKNQNISVLRAIRKIFLVALFMSKNNGRFLLPLYKVIQEKEI